MPTPATLDYQGAFRYAAAWASSVQVQTTDLSRNAHDFHGTLGSLDFEYTEMDHVLHVWSFILPGAAPLLHERKEVKDTIDRIAQQQPDETAGGVFDIRTLEWNRRASAKLEPCLYLRLEIVDATVPPEQMVKRLDHFSTTGFTWNRHKMLHVLDAYWAAHPKPAK